MQVEAITTPGDAPTVGGAMAASYARVVGHAPPSRSSWLVPLAQSALETDHWRAMWNFNAGNLTAAGGEDWIAIPTTSAAGRLRFRAYGTLGDGTDAMIGWLARNGALASADAGDVPGYVAALQKGDYAGSDPAVYGPYARTLAALVTELAGVEPIAYQAAAPRAWRRASSGASRRGPLFGAIAVALAAVVLAGRAAHG